MRSFDFRPWKIALLCALAIPVGSIAYIAVLAISLPTWTERGLFGDSFGALTALSSSLTLIGIAYTLFLQQNQLAESQRAVQLQQQPVLDVQVSQFSIDKPTIFSSPDESACHALARYRATLLFKSLSEVPAVNVVAIASLQIPSDKDVDRIRTIGHHIAFVTASEPMSETTMLVPGDHPTLLLRSLRQRDATGLPQVTVEVVYKNIMGACFAVRRGFFLLPSAESEHILRTWHTSLDSFGASFQSELRQMERRGFTAEAYNHIKEAFDRQVVGPENLEIVLRPIPGAHKILSVSPDEYDRFAKIAGTPRITFADTICLFESESQTIGRTRTSATGQ